MLKVSLENGMAVPKQPIKLANAYYAPQQEPVPARQRENAASDSVAQEVAAWMQKWGIPGDPMDILTAPFEKAATYELEYNPDFDMENPPFVDDFYSAFDFLYDNGINYEGAIQDVEETAAELIPDELYPLSDDAWIELEGIFL